MKEEHPELEPREMMAKMGEIVSDLCVLIFDAFGDGDGVLMGHFALCGSIVEIGTYES